MDRDPPREPAARGPTFGRSNRAILRSLVRLLVFAVLVAGLVLAGMVLVPTLVDDLEDLDDVEIVDRPAPSSDPPPAGERDPQVTDPGDPGVSSYETDVETVHSDDVEDFVHAEVNDRRAAHGLDPLEWDGTVASVARAHSTDMAERDYFAHTTPDGEGPFDRFRDVDDYCQGYGENIALTWIDRPVDQPNDDPVTYYTAEGLGEGLVDQWMNSTEHREAILEDHGGPSWDRGGVGVYISDDGGVYASHNFCTEWGSGTGW